MNNMLDVFGFVFICGLIFPGLVIVAHAIRIAMTSVPLLIPHLIDHEEVLQHAREEAEKEFQRRVGGHNG